MTILLICISHSFVDIYGDCVKCCNTIMKEATLAVVRALSLIQTKSSTMLRTYHEYEQFKCDSTSSSYLKLHYELYWNIQKITMLLRC